NGTGMGWKNEDLIAVSMANRLQFSPQGGDFKNFVNLIVRRSLSVRPRFSLHFSQDRKITTLPRLARWHCTSLLGRRHAIEKKAPGNGAP
ncbi:MAG TPA: hypothetical protein VK129_11195, partial [Terriglobales bacterium]|nr:hypothetical protein [Terriglobales bacterium]